MSTRNKIQSLLLLVLIFFYARASGQTAVEQALSLWENRQLVQAKETIDQYLNGDGESDAMAWLLKTRIYADLGHDPRYRSLVADPEMEAFDALVQAVKIDKIGITQKLAVNHSVVSSLYRTVTSRGISFFNAGIERNSPESYGAALEEFRQARRISGFMHQMNWGMPALDTGLVYNCSQAAINAGNEDQALLYAKILADKAVFHTTQHSKADFSNIYHWLIAYYAGKEDIANTEKYAEKGLSGYAGDLYFHQVLLSMYRKSGNYQSLFKAGERAIRQFPGQQKIHLAYSKDLFNYLYRLNTKEKQLIYVKLEESLTSYSNKFPTANDGSILLARHFFNKAADEQKARRPVRMTRQSLERSVQILQDLLGRKEQLNAEESGIVTDLLAEGLDALGKHKEADGYRASVKGM